MDKRNVSCAGLSINKVALFGNFGGGKRRPGLRLVYIYFKVLYYLFSIGYPGSQLANRLRIANANTDLMARDDIPALASSLTHVSLDVYVCSYLPPSVGCKKVKQHIGTLLPRGTGWTCFKQYEVFRSTFHNHQWLF